VDLTALQSLASRVSPLTGYRHTGDLAWSYTLHPDGEARVWRRDGEVVAWVWREEPDSILAQVDPAHPDLADEMLEWAGGVRELEFARSETALVAAAARRGYTPKGGPFMVCLRRGLADLPAIAELPAGYTIGPALSDVDGWVAAHRSAFSGSRMTSERYRTMSTLWPYRADSSLLASTSDGQGVAYCQGWYDEVSRSGQLEPVGTHAQYRRLGLARVVCLAVLHAFAAAGGEFAAVNCRGDADYPIPIQLYQSLGFREYTRTDFYHRRV
jgi:ribosomal protein S18 acetylase RimI-like enzyme